MRGRGERAGAIALAGLLCGCAASAVEPRPDARAGREPGSHIARVLAERRPPIDPGAPAATPRPAAAFRSPFGHELALAPSRNPDASIGGRDLHYWALGEGTQTLLVLGGIHGDEPSSAEAAYDLLAHVLRHPELLAGRRLVIAPEVNPDGLAAGTRRNLRDVDLNRNFPSRNWRPESHSPPHAPGLHAASEPETRFVLTLLRRFEPDRVVATHAAAACVNWDGPAEPLARAMSAECGLPAKASLGYPTPGSLGSFAGVEGGVPTITLELARKDSVGGEREAVRRALLCALRRCDPASDPELAATGAEGAAESGAPRFSPRR
jgi:protein MpaA